MRGGVAAIAFRTSADISVTFSRLSSFDVYIRPHELDLARTADGGNCLLGKVVHINPAGSVVKVRVVAEDFGLMLNIDIAPERHRELGLRVGEAVHVSPKTAKMFEPDYAI